MVVVLPEETADLDLGPIISITNPVFVFEPSAYQICCFFNLTTLYWIIFVSRLKPYSLLRVAGSSDTIALQLILVESSNIYYNFKQ